MAVNVNITPIGSGFNRSVINDNFVAIDNAFQQVLGRSGTTPNSMNADIDLNSNDLLNVGDINTQRLFVDGFEFITGDVSQVGERGWSPSLAVKDDGARRVLQLVAWVGGQGTAPTVGVGEYIGASGFEPLIANGVDIRGPTGPSGAGTGDMLSIQNLNDVDDKPTSFDNIKQSATDTYSGVVELATNAETITGTDLNRVVTPAGLTAKLATFSAPADVQTFLASDIWDKPATGNMAFIQVWGAGGSGARGANGGGGGAGGGGAYIERWVPLALLAASETVTIGAGGAARTSDNTDGQAGGNSSFGAWAVAYGGGGGNIAGGAGGGGGQKAVGANGISADVGGAGGGPMGGVGGNAAASPDTNATSSIHGGGGGGANSPSGNGAESIYGGGGGGGGRLSTNSGRPGGASMWGGGGGGGGSNGPAAGGASLYGGNGGAGADGGGVPATAGSQPGGGGGGNESGNSGKGGDGMIRVTVW